MTRRTGPEEPAEVSELGELIAQLEKERGVDPDTVSIGMPVEIYFVAASDDTGIPYWRPAA